MVSPYPPPEDAWGASDCSASRRRPNWRNIVRPSREPAPQSSGHRQALSRLDGLEAYDLGEHHDGHRHQPPRPRQAPGQHGIQKSRLAGSGAPPPATLPPWTSPIPTEGCRADRGESSQAIISLYQQASAHADRTIFPRTRAGSTRGGRSLGSRPARHDPGRAAHLDDLENHQSAGDPTSSRSNSRAVPELGANRLLHRAGWRAYLAQVPAAREHISGPFPWPGRLLTRSFFPGQDGLLLRP